MFVVFDNNKDLVTFTKDEQLALLLAIRYGGNYKNIR